MILSPRENFTMVTTEYFHQISPKLHKFYTSLTNNSYLLNLLYFNWKKQSKSKQKTWQSTNTPSLKASKHKLKIQYGGKLTKAQGIMGSHRDSWWCPRVFRACRLVFSLFEILNGWLSSVL